MSLTDYVLLLSEMSDITRETLPGPEPGNCKSSTGSGPEKQFLGFVCNPA